jgi:hypothetical protein
VSTSKRRGRRFLIITSIAALAVIAGIIIAVTVSIRVETGQWRLPEKQDFVRIARRFDHKPTKTIFLERNAVDLKPGEDDAARGLSSVLANATNKAARTKGWTGGDAKWKQLVGCVKTMFAPFDVAITDERPSGDNFMMVVVGGKPTDIGIVNSHHVSGLAPFNGEVIPRAVVYAFSATSNNDVRATCETIAMEVAHAYGLDHEYLCKDVMTYLTGCGTKSFVDADAACGESKQRSCEGGQPTQNSYKRLVAILGAAPGAAAPTAIATPTPTATTTKSTTTKTTTTKTGTKSTTTRTGTKTTTSTTAPTGDGHIGHTH